MSLFMDLCSHPWGRRPQKKRLIDLLLILQKVQACMYSVIWGQFYQQFKNDIMQTKYVNGQNTEFWNKGA